MNTLEEIKKRIIKQVPGASISLDPSETETGSSWLNIESGNNILVIEHRPSSGFGLYSSVDNSYGSRPYEVYSNIEPLLNRIFKFYKNKKNH